ncbi:MAG: magnesium transporter [Christensenellales bacterium]|jgi:magnesium transporter
MLEEILQLLEERRLAELSRRLGELNPADIAATLEELPEKDLPLVFRILPKDKAADTFVELDIDIQELLIHAFSDRELKAVMDQLYMDDTVDIIEEMPANVVRRILAVTTPEDRAAINQLLSYPEDSAGSLMTVEYVSLPRQLSVDQAIHRIRRTAVDKETIYTCYVTDPNRKLIGVITVKELLTQPGDACISDIMEENVLFVTTHEDKEQVAQLFSKYDMLALPVVDTERRLVGIITVDDAIDVMEEETTEDIEKMAAITPSERDYLHTGVFTIWKQRIPWLLILMVSATFTSKIINHFETALAAQTALIAFIPMLMDTSGNAGSQSAVTIIRGLSLNEIALRDVFTIIWKELRVSLLCGVSLAAAAFGKMLLIDRVSWMVALVVSITMAATVVLAKLVGSLFPLLAKRVKLDPAVMASPFITTIVDALALLVYFRVAAVLLQF